MRPDYDCVVVGAGLVGAAQALALQRLGLSVLALDIRAPLGGRPGGDVRGLALAPSSRNILAGLDLWPNLAPHVTAIEEVQVTDQGHFGAARLRADEVGFDALGYVCPADRLMHELESALTAAVDVRFETRVDGLDVADGIARIALGSDRGSDSLTTRLVIGADGADSGVRELIGITSKSRDYDQRAVVANLTIDGIDHHCAFERFTRDGPLALLPIGSGRHVAVRCCRAADLDRLIELDDETYLAELMSGFGDRFGSCSALGRRTHHPLRLRRATRIHDDRVVLVGAAANCIHPNGAQGLNLGLRDVAALAAAVNAGATDPGAAANLAAYAEARKPDHRAVLRLTDMLAQVFASRLPLVPLFRSAAMLALDVTPPMRRRVIRRACGLFGETPLGEWSADA